MSYKSELQAVSAALAVDSTKRDSNTSLYNTLIAAVPAGDVNLKAEYNAAKTGEATLKTRITTQKAAVDARIAEQTEP